MVSQQRRSRSLSHPRRPRPYLLRRALLPPARPQAPLVTVDAWDRCTFFNPELRGLIQRSSSVGGGVTTAWSGGKRSGTKRQGRSPANEGGPAFPTERP